MTVQREKIERLLPYADGKAYRNFLDGIHTAVTNEDYSGALQTFINWSNVSDPDKLLDGGIEDMEDRVMAFIKAQQEKGLAHATIRQRLAALRHFYDMNRITLNWKFIIKKGLGRGTPPKRDRAYKHSEIAALIEGAKFRDAALILVASSTGIREGAIADLNFSHIREITTLYGKAYRFVVYEGTNDEYITFCTPEAAKALDTYREYRQRYEEVISLTSPLFRNDFNKRLLASVQNVKRLTDLGIRDIVYSLAVSAGIRNPVKIGNNKDVEKIGSIRHEVKIFHGMKKFATTNMIRAKVESTYREFMLSHIKGRKELKVGELEMIYDRPEDSDLLKEYTKAIPFLTISNEERARLELVETKEKLRSQEELRAMLEEQKRRVDAIKAQVESLPNTAETIAIKNKVQMMAVAATYKGRKLTKEQYYALVEAAKVLEDLKH